MPYSQIPVAVVGGGVAGLAAAFHLQEIGVQVSLYEAAGRPGGVIRSVERDGFLVDVGPNTLLPRPQALEDAIAALGLKEQRVWADAVSTKRYIVRDGRLVPLPLSPRRLLSTPLLSARTKLRLLGEPLVRRARDARDESLAAFIRRRLGPEVLDYAVNPFVAGVFAGDPERLSARHAFPRLWALEGEHGSLLRGLIASRRPDAGGAAERRSATDVSPDGEGGSRAPGRGRPFSFTDGMQTMTDALAGRLGGIVHVDTPVRGVRRQAGGYVLDIELAGQVEEVHARAVVLALPAPQLAAVLVDPGVDLEPLAEVFYPPVTVLALGFRREDVAHPLDGFGVLIPEREPFRLLGALFSSTLFPGRAPEGQVLLSCFLGGARHPEDGRLDEAEQVALALTDLRRLLGVRGEPTFVLRQPWSRAIPQYEVGYGTVLDVLDDIETAWPGAVVAGTVRGGISVGEALASGIEAARRVVAHLVAA